MNGQYTDELELNLLRNTYNEIANKFPNLKIDSFDVVKAVIEHRNYWRPTKVKTILLAESHVFTPDKEFNIELNYPNEIEFAGLPRNYVRLVYCLGYGEEYLPKNYIDNNKRGTPQYWKLFSACLSENWEIEFYRVSKTKCPNFTVRIINKLDTLKRLKEGGIWLVDSSIVGLYNFGKTIDYKNMQEILQLCWDKYIYSIIHTNTPNTIIVIGKSVYKSLSSRLKVTNIRFLETPQPQARLSSIEHNNALNTYYQICNE